MRALLKYSIPRILTIVISMALCECKPAPEPAVADSGKAQANITAQAKPHNTAGDTTASRKPLTLIISNLASPTAPVIIGIYNSTYKFLYKEGRLKEYTLYPKGNTLTASITGIPYGTIAVVVYQDMNSNDKFDKNFIGLPKEGYAFSNNYKPTVKAPNFDDCKFNYDSASPAVKISLIK